ncbi:MAG TPA: glycosyl hydrolase family 65 protein [Kofleriaceae bacterium]|nr:glycosyl hydrolase family 65 protein [Kofleriaceae bacterium]
MIGWELVYDRYEPAVEGVRETLCTLGNGYFATRGAPAESSADGVHYPGTYIAGCYNRLTTPIEGVVHESEDLVNAPNWLPLTFREPGGAWLGTEPAELLSYRQTLDLRRGVLSREVRVRDRRGHTTRIASRRLVHMGQPHLAALEVTLTAEDWSGPIEVRSALDGTVRNCGVERYRLLKSQHLVPLEARSAGDDVIFLEARTVQSRLLIAEAARTRVFEGGAPRACARRTDVHEGVVAHELALELEPGRPVTIEKVVAIHTSRDRAISEPGLAARELVAAAPGFEALLASHALAWEHLWRSFDVEIELDDGEAEELDTGVILRLHVFHLLQTASRNSTDLDVGVGARGLHGEAYRGHVFWDELFVFPFLNLRMPDLTRGLLLYRYRRLPAARRAARAAGYRGAMYPWQSGSDGREETPRAYFNPRSGRWIADHTYLQRHVGAAIVYNVWQYYQVTGDVLFFGRAGAEIVLEVARFFASLATHDPEADRYEIRGVMGPDEFHSGYPDAERPGLDNNAYTNLMAVWVLCRALDVLQILPPDRRRELRERLALGDDEVAAWDAISRKMRLVFLGDGILAQFEGYDQLRELDWDGYRARHGNIQRLDLILEAEGDDPNRYKLSKQADVLMLFFLFSAEELRALFERLGYPFEAAAIPRTIAYYMRRTSEGSTLSRVAHAWVLARSDRHRSWALFREALQSDVADIQGGTTREGIHLGAMAGTVDLLQRCYTGLELRGDVLWLKPHLPEGVRRLELLVHYRVHTLELAITRTSLEVNAARCETPAIQIGLDGQVHELRAGERRVFPLP